MMWTRASLEYDSAVSQKDWQVGSKRILTVHAHEEIKSTAEFGCKRSSGAKFTKFGDFGERGSSGITE